MLYGNEQKNMTATRLKKLREDRNLSHEKLKYQLDKMYYEDKDSGEIRRRIDSEMKEDGEEYPSIISLSTLKNYEVLFFDGVKGNRAKAGFGMKILYIAMFADFYNVSVEYLLGFTKFKTPSIEEKAIHEKTGLSDVAIKNLVSKYKSFNTLNLLLEDEGFFWLIRNINIHKESYIKKLNFLKENEFLYTMPSGKDDEGFITLNPSDYCDYLEYELQKDFIDLLHNVVNSSIKNNILEDI